MSWWKKILWFTLTIIIVFALVLWYLAQAVKPEKITYGMSFNTMYASELGLDWKETYDAIMDDLGVRHFRLAAHWPMIEPASGVYNFTELDYQIKRAEEMNAEVILAVGRRLPRWPECHVPDWAKNLSLEERNFQQLEYMKQVVERYKNSSSCTLLAG
ncbi:MAG: Beta-galactosidase LacZ [Parcubacteria bacterium OLB19]|nr:MAG: Beta-galactosidase LacZ [Parcubacteria bacterium OLB19]